MSTGSMAVAISYSFLDRDSNKIINPSSIKFVIYNLKFRVIMIMIKVDLKIIGVIIDKTDRSFVINNTGVGSKSFCLY